MLFCVFMFFCVWLLSNLCAVVLRFFTDSQGNTTYVKCVCLFHVFMAGIPTAEIAKRQYFGRYKILPWLNLSDCRKVERWLQAHTWTTIESRWIGNSTLCVSLLILGNWCISAYLHLCISAYLHQIGCWYHTDQYINVNSEVLVCMVIIRWW